MTRLEEELLLQCTSLIHTEDIHGNREQATCFFLKRKNGSKEHHYLVTCAHVLKDACRIHIYLNQLHSNGKDITYHKKITLTPNGALRIHPDCDLALLCIDSIQSRNFQADRYLYQAIDISFIPKDYTVFSAFQSILMVGYPSGIHDATTNLPIGRTGITSTPLYSFYTGKGEFLIDIPFLSGSSGSPVFAIENGKTYLVGIEYSKLLDKITLDKKPQRLYHSQKYTKEIETGLGIAIRADRILELF